ncbi:hypothetical protein CL621_00245 [archaeon]|nr:hypothetical protein [archaeon]
MKILAFVDLHGNKLFLNEIIERAKREKPHLIICAGDLSDWGRNLNSILSKINKIGILTLIIHGNHESEEELTKIIKPLKSIIFLHGSSYKINKYIFFGYGGGGFALEDKKLEKIIKKVKTIKKRSKIILVTHAPPYNTTLDRLDHMGHLGSKSIRKFIEEVNPVLNICGHLHENTGNVDKIKRTKIINPGNGAILEV